MTSFDPKTLGVNVTSLQAGYKDTLAILHKENMWICNKGASVHVTWSRNGTKIVPDTKMYNFGHTDRAMESTALIDIPCVFATKNGYNGIQAVLKECSYGVGHNFNLVSMSKLLHK